MGAGFAAIIIKREKDLAAHFRDQRATSVSTAQPLDVLRVEHNNIFRRLEDRAVIRHGAGGTYYFDEPSWNAMRRMRQRILFIVVVLAVAFASSMIIAARGKDAARDTLPASANQ